MMSSLHRQTLWQKTDGHCGYCGVQLHADNVQSISGKYQSWMEIDHVTPLKDGGDGSLENLMPSCASCNASKGRRSLEAYRYQMAKKASGRPHIPREVHDWLEEVGVVLPDLPKFEFWFERNRTVMERAA